MNADERAKIAPWFGEQLWMIVAHPCYEGELTLANIGFEDESD